MASSDKSNRQKVCIICLKRFSLGDYPEKQNEDKRLSCEGKNEDEDKRSDLYSRFLLFLNRHFKLTCTERFLNSAKENGGDGVEVTAFCNACAELVGYICDLYRELQMGKLYLLWKLGEMGELMRGSGRKISRKLTKGLLAALTEQLNVKVVRQLIMFRKMVQLKCSKAEKDAAPKITAHRGLFPDHWKFTYSATKQMLVRLIVVFILASSKVHSKASPETTLPVELPTDDDNNACKVEDKQLNERLRDKSRRSRRPRTKAPTAPDNLKTDSNTVDEATPDETEGGTIKMEEGGPQENTSVLDDNDEKFTDQKDDFNNDSDSDWSHNTPAASPMSPDPNSSSAVSSSDTDESVIATRARKSKRSRASKMDFPSKKLKRKNPSTSTIPNKKATLKCFKCPRQFVDTRGLAHHLHAFHQSSHSYPCAKCGMRFNRKQHLLQHHKTNHGIHYPDGRHHRGRPAVQTKCKDCSQLFPTKTAMLLHRKNSICGRNSKDSKRTAEEYALLDPGSPPPPPPEGEETTKRKVTFSWTKRQLQKERILMDQWIKSPCGVDECQEMFESVYLLRKHLENIHEERRTPPEKVIQCMFCWKKFCHRKAFDLHMRSEHKSKLFAKFRCDLETCDGEGFLTVEQLNEHLTSHVVCSGEEVGNGVYFCSRCNWGFLKEITRDVHELDHLEILKVDGGLYKCPQCPQVLPRRNNVRHHFNMVHGNDLRPLPCDLCDKRFFAKPSLVAHKKLHDRRIRAVKTTLESGEVVTEFVCVTCGAKCKDQHLLDKHRESHLEENQIRCKEPGCGAKFRCRKTLWYHRKRVHGNGQQWICDLCGKSFIFRFMLGIHKKTHEGASWVCNECGLRFTRKAGLETHMDRKHNPQREMKHVCVECGKTFFSDAGLKYHFDSSHKPESEWKWECVHCRKKFHRKMLLMGHVKNCSRRGDGGPGGEELGE